MDSCRKQAKSDCEELLRRFQQTGSVRFEIFTNIWREMKFAQIFYGTVNHASRVFSRKVLDTACSFFLPPYSFQIRVGGLYLLYSLYHCQTASPPERIRLALKDWEDVERFEKDAVDAQHFDTVYILRQLKSCKAFHFTAMPTLLAFKRQKNVERMVLCEEFMERPSCPQELINIELLEEMSNIHDLYKKLKTSVISEASAQMDPSINLIHENLVPELRGTVVDFYQWQQRKESVDDDEDVGEGTSSQQECSQRADLLASIKSKAYGQAAEVSKSRRHRQVEVDFTCNEAGPAPTSDRTRIIKPALKTRITETLHVSGDLWKEATTTTSIHKLTLVDYVAEEKPKKRKKMKWC